MITNEWILGTGDISDALAVREKVFIEEQNVEPEIERDDADVFAVHLVIYDDGVPVATGRVWHDGRMFRIGRCAVTKDKRGQGIGDLLVKLLLLKAFEYDPSKVAIHAQIYAEPFYNRYGFRRTGEPFPEADIEHVPMEVTKETLTFPSACGDKHYEDLFTKTTKLNV